MEGTRPSALSAKTDFLIVARNQDQNLKKAGPYGVRTISYPELLKRLRRTGSPDCFDDSKQKEALF